eukprot:4177568-Pyramimonas_sp.AAC.1
MREAVQIGRQLERRESRDRLREERKQLAALESFKRESGQVIARKVHALHPDAVGLELAAVPCPFGHAVALAPVDSKIAVGAA